MDRDPISAHDGYVLVGGRYLLRDGTSPAGRHRSQRRRQTMDVEAPTPRGAARDQRAARPGGQPVVLKMTPRTSSTPSSCRRFVSKTTCCRAATGLWFEATKIGHFHVFAPNTVVTGHAEMVGRVVVMERERVQLRDRRDTAASRSPARGTFEQFRSSMRRLSSGGARRARQRSKGCSANQVKLQDGGTVVANEDYFRESILDRRPRSSPAREPIMPTFQGQESSEEGSCRLLAFSDPRSKGNRRTRSATDPGDAAPAAVISMLPFRRPSWLLTTDHKRIAILYMISITFFFVVGGAAAALMRLELMTPTGDLVSRKPTTSCSRCTASSWSSSS